VAYHAVGLFPLAWLLFDFWFGLLGPEPIRAMILRTGKAAIIMLTLSLVATPAGWLLRWKDATTVRRPVWLDYALIVPLIVEEIVARRYALVGFAAFLLLIPLAVTSTKGWQKRLGKRWKMLHKLVYLIAVLAVVHYIWLVKNAYTQPLIFAAAVGLLLLLRVPAIKQALLRARGRR